MKIMGYFGLFQKFCTLICTDGSKLKAIESLEKISENFLTLRKYLKK
jgi:hypothetical protein